MNDYGPFWESPPFISTCRIPLHFVVAKVEQPQNCDPALSPRLAVLKTIGLRHTGHVGVVVGVGNGEMVAVVFTVSCCG